MLNKMKHILCGLKKLSQMRIPLTAVLCAASIGAATLLVNSVNTVRINDGENIYTVRTIVGGIADALDSVTLKSDDYRVLSTSVGSRLTKVNIAYTFPVFVTVGDKTEKLTVVSSTVEEILAQLGHTVDEYDMVEPSADTVITETSYIDYVDIDYVSGSYTEAIPCGMDTVYSDKYEKGTKTVQNGTNGEKLVEYTSKVVNGVTVETTVNSIVTLSNAVNGKNIIGTAVSKKSSVLTSENVKSVSTLKPSSPIELDENGVPVNYKRHMTVQATAYTYTGNNCATGVTPQPGYIAVNPDVIPYGTKMYIKSSDGSYIYGYAVAADTGGFTKSKPNNVDLFFASKSACAAFGRRNVEIYILE